MPKSDLQSQVKRFKERAEKAERQASETGAMLMAARQHIESLIQERAQLQTMVQQARMIATAIVCQNGDFITLTPETLQAVEDGRFLGVDLDKTEEGEILVYPTFGTVEEEEVIQAEFLPEEEERSTDPVEFDYENDAEWGEEE